MQPASWTLTLEPSDQIIQPGRELVQLPQAENHLSFLPLFLAFDYSFWFTLGDPLLCPHSPELCSSMQQLPLSKHAPINANSITSRHYQKGVSVLQWQLHSYYGESITWGHCCTVKDTQERTHIWEQLPPPLCLMLGGLELKGKFYSLFVLFCFFVFVFFFSLMLLSPF